MLKPWQVRQYEENGFLILPNVIPKRICEEIKAVAENLADDDFAVCLNIHRKSTYFWNLAKSRKLLDVVESVQKTAFDITNDQFLYKKSGTPFARQAWSPHQDATYVDAPRGTYLQIHLMLDAQDKRNGGIYYYPGSHKEEMLPYVYNKSWREEPDEHGISHPGWRVRVPWGYKRVDVDVEAGTVFLQHGNLIHGSYANLSSRSRAQYSIAFLNKGVKINKGEASVKIAQAVS